MATKLEGGGGKALMARPLREFFFAASLRIQVVAPPLVQEGTGIKMVNSILPW